MAAACRRLVLKVATLPLVRLLAHPARPAGSRTRVASHRVPLALLENIMIKQDKVRVPLAPLENIMIKQDKVRVPLAMIALLIIID